ncbi:uncharacterized protein PHALS_14763 [Plasmopara halstedii]|uniref:Uncharacterized protein n=1 Tax=Plasmopara halstedii TaxID=4781 RepID=A0A0P1ARA5_PLAHL|nr:uncharacterized protein PHALS_14763 [Plasmopara halstedii]CEG43964.1 hypothetical protein PHALS_14763 [Plasmopara halstedii]|eukprot:XP_024580333.1 hypothetical protein PHALS_14763 [Plasmopara halstedii]
MMCNTAKLEEVFTGRCFLCREGNRSKRVTCACPDCRLKSFSSRPFHYIAFKVCNSQHRTRHSLVENCDLLLAQKSCIFPPQR